MDLSDLLKIADVMNEVTGMTACHSGDAARLIDRLNVAGFEVVMSTGYHELVTTLAELDALDSKELIEGHLSAERGDPEPGANHSRSFHHGWRTRMMDIGELVITPEHRTLVKEWCGRQRESQSCRP